VTFETPGVDGGGARLALKPAQEAALAALENGELTELTRAAYEDLTGVSRSQAAYDLADLVTLGVLERLGAGRATRYRLGRGAGGRTRKWTEERIRDGLEAFSAQVGRWPRAVEFREAGHGDLYLAASRYGGIEYWAAELGFRDWSEPDVEPEPALDEANEDPQGEAALEKAGPAYPFPSSRPTPLLGVGTAAILVAGAVVLAAITFGGLFYFVDRGPTVAALPPANAPAEPLGSGPGTPEGRTAAPAAVDAGREKPTPPVTLRVRAAGGSSWTEVRASSSDGKLLYRGTLVGDRSLRFTGHRLWLRLGAPANLRASLNGRGIDLPGRTSTVVVTKRGLRVVKLAPSAPQPAPPAEEAPEQEEAIIVSEPADVSSTPPSTTSSSTDTSSSPPPPQETGGTPSPDQPPSGDGGGPSPDAPPQRP
jgi:hypothetical protein